jgi:hypothetical protein
MSPKKITTPIKPPEISSITHEENEEIHNKLSKLEDQLNDLSARSITSNEVVNTQRKIQRDDGTNGKKMDMEQMEKMEKWNKWKIRWMKIGIKWKRRWMN